MARPNLLFVYTDQQRSDSLAAYGNHLIQTPNLNRLAEESVVFEKAYVTEPVCQPSRAALMTGMYPHAAAGLTGDLNNRLHGLNSCLPELVEHGNYVCGHHGKWHLGDDVFAQHGFDDWISTEDHEHRPFYSEGKDSFQPSTYHEFLLDQGFEPDYEAPDGFRAFTHTFHAGVPEEYGQPAFLARHASQFIRDNKARPFILFVSIFEPHQPYFGPRDSQYDPAQVPLPPNFTDVPTKEQPLKIRALYHIYEEQGFGVPLKTELDWRQLTAKYWGNCSLVDTHVGTILDTLEECGVGDNTIVVFTSDHGEMMGSHRLRGKGFMFEEAVRVPLLIRLPGQRKGKRVEGPVSHVDLMPTLLELMDQPIPGHLQGTSLSPLFQQRGTSANNRDVFVQWQGPLGVSPFPEAMRGVASEADLKASSEDSARTIVTPDGWKFNCSKLGEHELYNLHEDPVETRNLARDPQYSSLLRDLTTRLWRWQEETGDTVDLSSANELF